MIQSTNSLQNLLPESRYLRLSGFGSPLDIGLIIRHIGDTALIRLFNGCRGLLFQGCFFILMCLKKVTFLKQLLLRNCAVDFVEICNVYVGKMIIKVGKRIFNSGKLCRSYSDLNFGVTFFGTQCI